MDKAKKFTVEMNMLQGMFVARSIEDFIEKQKLLSQEDQRAGRTMTPALRQQVTEDLETLKQEIQSKVDAVMR